MSFAGPEPAAVDLFAALLRGEAIPWAAFAMPSTEFVRTCIEQRLTGLIHERLRTLPQECEWPPSVRDALAREVRAHAAKELLHHKELQAVSSALAAESLFPIFLKGTALAYSVYDAPSSRPRLDTDLLIRRDEMSRIRNVMAGLGYTAPLLCEGDLLFCQFPLQKTTDAGIVHTFDCHWKISTQSVFADVLTFDEVAARAAALPPLGAHARALAPLDALLLACIHPVMHHRNAESLIWLFDIHLLASTLSEQEFERFAEMAIAKRVSSICAHQLTAARTKLATRMPEAAIRKMTRSGQRESSAVYLRPNRRWADELMSNIRGLPRWGERLRLIREVLVPGHAYMLKAYGFERSRVGVALLPLLYLHRLLFGGWKLVAGRK